MVSLIIAMIFLMQFYLQFKESLRHHNPFLKFMEIKFVVFLSYVQTVSGTPPRMDVLALTFHLFFPVHTRPAHYG